MRLSARVDSVEGSLPSSVRSSRVEWSARRGLLVTLEDGHGGWGQGEASPLPGYSPEGFDDVAAALAVFVESGVELDAEGDALAQAHTLARRVDISLPSARFALETAAIDFISRRRGEPFHAVLGSASPRPIPLAALLHASESELLVGEARGWLERGVVDLKLKIGRDLDAELAHLEAIRASVGDGFRLRVDANGAIPPEGARALLARLHELGVSLIEEPVSFEEMGAIGEGTVPVALDESLHGRGGEERLRRALDEGWLGAVVLKPMALGGSLAALGLARVASERGVGAIVTHLFDGPVGRAAAGALALALPRPLAAGLVAHGGLEVWPELPSPMFEDARLIPLEAPGLGLPRLEIGA